MAEEIFTIAWIIFMTGIALISISSFIFWLFMLIDAAKRKFKDGSDKVAWILVIVLVGIIGAIIYYFVIKRKNKH